MSSAYSNGDISIAVCDRCKFKYPYRHLRSDGSAPGLRVCERCYDIPNPWVNWQPKSYNITLRYPRPDQQLTTTFIQVTNQAPILTAQKQQFYKSAITTEDGINIQAQNNPPNSQWLNKYIPPSLLES